MRRFPQSRRTPFVVKDRKLPIKYYRISALIGFAAIFLFFTINSLVNDSSAVMSQLGNDVIGIAGADQSMYIYYEDISSVDYIESLDPGMFVDGTETEDAYFATYQNDAYGQYQLFAYKHPGVYIVIQHTGGIIVFNSSSVRDTEVCYQNLKRAIKAYQSSLP